MTATTFGRFGVVARLAVAFAFALLLAGAMAGGTRAADNNAMDKNAFKQGCESGGGSYVENNDGSFQCNLKDGGTIKCPSTTSQCSYIPRSVVAGQVGAVKAGNVTVAVSDGGTGGKPGRAGAVNRAALANRAVLTEATPTP